jgi:hypothetical protein
MSFLSKVQAASDQTTSVTLEDVARHFCAVEHYWDDQYGPNKKGYESLKTKKKLTDYEDNEVSEYRDMIKEYGSRWKLGLLPVAKIEGEFNHGPTDPENIPHYTKLTLSGSKFPAIIVRKGSKQGTYITVDGQHRLQVAKMLKHTHILAYFPV